MINASRRSFFANLSTFERRSGLKKISFYKIAIFKIGWLSKFQSNRFWGDAHLSLGAAQAPPTNMGSLWFTLGKLWGLLFIMPLGGVGSHSLVVDGWTFGCKVGWFWFGLRASIVTVNQLSVTVIGLLCIVLIYFTLRYTAKFFSIQIILFSSPWIN